MKKYQLAGVAACVALAGCGEAPAEDELTPGDWKLTITMSDFEVPGATPEQAALFANAAPDPMSQNQCIADGENKVDADLVASAFQQSGDCKASDFAIADGAISGKLVCDIGEGETTESDITGTIGSDAFSMNVATQLLQSAFPEGRANVKVEMSGERVGDC